MSNVLTIQRSKWARGGLLDTRLLNSDGMMCCLGFDALACGLTEEQIRGHYRPSDLEDAPLEYKQSRRGWPQPQGHPIEDAIGANDSPFMSPATREQKVREALMALGWADVVFVD